MTKKIYKKVRPYFYLVPVVFLFAMGILLRSTVTTTKGAVSAPGCNVSDTTGTINPFERLAYFEGKTVNIPSEYLAESKSVDTAVLGVADTDERWIEVDISEQKLRAWEGQSLFLESLISSGLPGWDTPRGEFRVWMKIRATKMEGGEGKLYYNLPNVPYVMFFENSEIPNWRGFGLHGTYWHNDFGKQHSHGCVNLPTDIAHVLYDWTSPHLPEGKGSVRADEQNIGTRVVIHD